MSYDPANGEQQPYYNYPPNVPPPNYQYPVYPYPPSAASASSAAVVIGGNRKGTAHGFHLLMTLLTGGLWIPVWIVCAVKNG